MEQRYFDGVFIPSGLWKARDLTWMEKILLAEIRSRQTGEWFSIKNSALAEALGVSDATVSGYLARLSSKGFLSLKGEGEARQISIAKNSNILWFSLQNPEGNLQDPEGGVQNLEGNNSLSDQSLNPLGLPETLHNIAFRETKKERTKEKSITSNSTSNTMDIYKSKNRANISLEEVVAEYHRLLPALPKCVALTDKRRTMLRARCRETIVLDGRTQDPSTLDFWQKFFRFVGDSAFLTGKTMPSNGRKRFIADIDFLLSPQGFGRIIDGKYHRE